MSENAEYLDGVRFIRTLDMPCPYISGLECQSVTGN